MGGTRNIEGHGYPAAHRGWGGFAEELFHYTSRYYAAAEAFLRSLAGRPDFSLSGYKAAQLSDAQRALLADVLACRPDATTAAHVITIVDAVKAGNGDVDPALAEAYRARVGAAAPVAGQRVQPEGAASDEVAPLDPFLSLAERLLMPVAVRDHHVEISLLELARHLDSPNATLRSNLQRAIVALHDAGYVLRNHPHLTHAEADLIGERAPD